MNVESRSYKKVFILFLLTYGNSTTFKLKFELPAIYLPDISKHLLKIN